MPARPQELASLAALRAARAASDGPVVVLFTAQWCKPCQSFKATFQSFVSHLNDIFSNALIFTVDRDEENAEETFESFGVTKMPSVLFLGAGESEKKTILQRPDFDALLEGYTSVLSVPSLVLSEDF